MSHANMSTISVNHQRQEEYPTPGPISLTSQQLRELPSFNRRRAALLSGGVRNLPVVGCPTSLTDSHIPRGNKVITAKPKSAIKCVRVTILDSDDHLPRCKIGSCANKAHYSQGDKNVTVCATHRNATHVRVYALLNTRRACHCGTRATYGVPGQAPTHCYWHKQSGHQTRFSFQRFSVHHRGKFVSSYTVPKDSDQTAIDLLKSGIEPNPGPPKLREGWKPPKSVGKSKKYTAVVKEVKAIEEAVRDNRAKEQADPTADLEAEAKAAKRQNDTELAIMNESIRKLYLEKLAHTTHLDLDSKISGKERAFELHEAEDKAAVHVAETILNKAKTDAYAARLALYLAENKDHLEKQLSTPKTTIELEKTAAELFKAQQYRERMPLEEAIKIDEVRALHSVSRDSAEAKQAAVQIEALKLRRQLKETALQAAPFDGYNLASSEGFEFFYKEEKFHYDLRPAIALIVAFLTFVGAWLIGLPGIIVAFLSIAVCLTCTTVVFQIQDPSLRYKCGSDYRYASRNGFAEVPGKPALEMDVRMENDRRDLVKYEGLVRFFDVTHRYVSPIKFLTYEIPWLKRYHEKNTVIAVSVGLLQQVITKRVSYCDEESWVRSKIEYNMSNMTNVNVDKELMYIAHPDSGRPHGFAVFQQTVDAAWGWFMSQKQMNKHVPRPRAVVSQPK